MNVTNLACVVIWYNPTIDAVKNIQKYSIHFERIFIIDNSFSNNSNLAEKISNSTYLSNNSNLGIAKALNIGCNFALNNNFEWCMTMDQDSSWEHDELTLFFSEIEKIDNQEIMSFAPSHTNAIKSQVGYVIDSKKNGSKHNFLFKNKVMTSGNLINLKTWNLVGKFNELLFIDEVDHEFCYRLNNSGFKICEFQNIFMIHTLGNVKRTFLPRPCKHSGVRLYYIFRNILYIKKMFPFYYKIEKYRRYMTFAIIQKILEFKFKDLKYIHQGKKAFKHNNFGAYNY